MGLVCAALLFLLAVGLLWRFYDPWEQLMFERRRSAGLTDELRLVRQRLDIWKEMAELKDMRLELIEQRAELEKE
jgi:hypothetical protein